MKKIVIAIVIAIAVLAGLIFNTVREDKLTDSFKQYYAQNQPTYSQIFISKYRKYYDEFHEDSQEAIEYKDPKAMELIRTKYANLAKEALPYAQQYLGAELAELTNINLSKLKESDRKMVEGQIDEAKALVAKGQYATADNLILEIKTNINERLQKDK